ncbi:MAG: M4 family metallopeptidase, partial [Gammaproteobacteria bacterium]|nr:M4 family metallopeptidase [Gammaproteobacteria bacterium]
VVHLDALDRVFYFNGRYQPSFVTALRRFQLSEEQVKERVLADLGLSQVWKITLGQVIYGDKNPRLTYRVDVNPRLGSRWLYFVDASSGEILHRLNNLHDGVQRSSGVDLLGRAQTFSSWSQEGVSYLIDPQTPLNDLLAKDDPVLHGPKVKGDTFIYDAQQGDGTQLEFVTQNGSWDPVAVSAMVHTRQVYDYFLQQHGRQSLDDQNKNLLVAIHFGDRQDNAFWNGSMMVYGDGDSLFEPLVKCLDVAAHEMTHGVIESSANLRYENQSGALNESFADVFAALVDGDDWLIGEDCTLAAPRYLRSLADPHLGRLRQPSSMDEYLNLPNTPEGDNGGVHINSGIPNRAAYLIAEALGGEGRRVMGEIYYHALTRYLTSSAQFIDARRALTQAAVDLYGSGSAEAQAVAEAWDQVGVLEGLSSASDNQPQAAPLVEGEQLMVYLRPEDGSHDGGIDENYFLYLDNLSDPAAESQQVSLQAAFYSKAALFTDLSGTHVLFVGQDLNLYRSDLSLPLFSRTRRLTTEGNLWSVAVSPDGQQIAYTTAALDDNRIHLLSYAGGDFEQRSFAIPLPNYQQGSDSSLGLVRYADSLSFDYSGSTLLFDMKVCVPQPQRPCLVENDGSGYNYWSIGFLDLARSTAEVPLFRFPFASQNPSISLGYPVFAANSTSVVALDLIEQDANGVRSRVVSIDFEGQRINTVYDYLRFGRDEPFWGVPSFWGDDLSLTVQQPLNSTAEVSVCQVPLGTESSAWEGVTAGVTSLNSAAVAMPIMHRAGVRDLSARLQASSTLLDFGDVALGEVKTRLVTLHNRGNRPLDIIAIELDDDDFRHNGSNLRLQIGGSITLAVNFVPNQTGVKTATLRFITTGSPSMLSVSLSGSVAEVEGQGEISERVLFGLLLTWGLSLARQGGRVQRQWARFGNSGKGCDSSRD